MARDVLLTRGMSTNTQLLAVEAAASAFALETTQLGAVSLAILLFAERLPGRNSAQRRELRAGAAKMRFHLKVAAGASRAKRRRECYERARERLSVVALALVDMQHLAQITPDAFDAGRALSLRAKALLDAQLAALETMAPTDQRDAAKLDDVLLGADQAANTAPTSEAVHSPATPAAAPSLGTDPKARHPQPAHVAPNTGGAHVGRNGGVPRTNATATALNRRNSRS
jgi:hypothetical protein